MGIFPILIWQIVWYKKQYSLAGDCFLLIISLNILCKTTQTLANFDRHKYLFDIKWNGRRCQSILLTVKYLYFSQKQQIM